MLTEIRLYGALGKQFGKKWELVIRRPADAINAIDTLRPGFKAAILKLSSQGGFDFWVRVGGHTIGARHLPMLHYGRTICITPVLRGAASTKGIIELIAGVALVAIGALTFGITSVYGAQLILLGAALALGGIASFLAPAPAAQTSNKGKNKPSYQFSGPVNTIEQGLPVQVCYGEVICGTNVISVALQTSDITQGSTATGSGSGGASNQGPTNAAQPISSNKVDWS